MILAVQILNKLLQDDANFSSFPDIRNWINFEFDKESIESLVEYNCHN
jgi:hypothetical protein